ncbi:hypothetical protein [Xanthocytophaga flava]|nr:hypothetical protein [Xanthocytophaga flavus]MDJ1471197.1 hypothetical protein [Xanthocytophaga flavus]
MERTTHVTFDKSAYNPVIFKTYKLVKKLTKYTIYITMLYFMFEGFMAWK